MKMSSIIPACANWPRQLFAVCLLCVSTGSATAAVSVPNPAATLRDRYVTLHEQLNHNPFQQPLVLSSTESSSDLQGDIYALVDYPLAIVSTALQGSTHWCDVLILHINTKYCHAATSPAGTTMSVNIGSKNAQQLEQSYRVEFKYRLVTSQPDYFQVQFHAEEGPLSTSNYRIMLEAVAIGRGQTFVHLRYSYAYGFASELAMKSYLLTLGRSKVGFTIVGKQPDGQPEYMQGMRGVVERNTMRYFLAIEAYLSAVSAPPAQQLEQRLQHWFSATERYPRQLHEVDRSTFLAMKRDEYLRQQTPQ